jgi:flagellar protein FlaG
MNVSIAFETSEEGGKVVVAVINRETGELIRKIPPEDLIDRLNRFEGFEGLLTQAKV